MSYILCIVLIPLEDIGLCMYPENNSEIICIFTNEKVELEEVK